MAGCSFSLTIWHHTRELSAVIFVQISEQECSIAERRWSWTPENLVVSPPLHLVHWVSWHWAQQEQVTSCHSCHVHLSSTNWRPCKKKFSKLYFLLNMNNSSWWYCIWEQGITSWLVSGSVLLWCKLHRKCNKKYWVWVDCGWCEGIHVYLHTININPGSMRSAGNSVGGNTLVHTPVPGMNARDIQMTDYFTSWTQILPYHQPEISRRSRTTSLTHNQEMNTRKGL